ncbi:brct domain containing protein [Grosmannia clavigera kw1407]|uniref:Brct domain containing protein n=1 Tax=Grosmannia clavigera (strain kw1407 / UAMH 11150) TaxID=655863 RepID=F0XGX6_GROCL|nr:brct domain containing protein [Grosmannia clavigera kw1407]EFX02641.1 brct domain containing protein [Grosmannia clavigera kw1407]
MPVSSGGACRQKLVMAGITVAVAGSLGSGWTDADVARWMAYNGGRFAASVTGDVTHLLCTPEEYARPKKKQDPALREALRRGPKNVHIVLKDWLEDSLHRRSRRREKAYLLRHIHRPSQQHHKEMQERQERLRAKGRQLGETFVDTTLYHIYQDATGFSYKVTIQRDHENCGIFGERYVLHLFESDARPHLYWFAARHYKSRTHTQPRDYRPSDTCRLFETEFRHFCTFFARKTGVSWDERMVAEAPTKTMKDTNTKEADVHDLSVILDFGPETSSYFRYVRPARGMPMGVIDKAENMPRPNIEEINLDGGYEQGQRHA